VVHHVQRRGRDRQRQRLQHRHRGLVGEPLDHLGQIGGVELLGQLGRVERVALEGLLEIGS